MFYYYYGMIYLISGMAMAVSTPHIIIYLNTNVKQVLLVRLKKQFYHEIIQNSKILFCIKIFFVNNYCYWMREDVNKYKTKTEWIRMRELTELSFQMTFEL